MTFSRILQKEEDLQTLTQIEIQQVKMIKHTHKLLIALSSIFLLAAACDKTESYSELLKDEEKAVNWFLANRNVEPAFPEDSISFKTGENAPFYKMDTDGNIYMQVVRKGDGGKVDKGDLVYFRYMRSNIKYMYEGISVTPVGNADNLSSGSNSTAFVFGVYNIDAYSDYGRGIQKPLEFLGYDSEVNLVLKSYYGFLSDQSSCTPYLINIRYFNAEY